MISIKRELIIMKIFSYIKVLLKAKSKNFIKNLIFRSLIKSIKRKNTKGCNSNDLSKLDEGDLIQSFQKEMSLKRISKQNLEKILLNFSKQLEMSNEKQRNLEQKYEELEKKTEEFYIQNKSLMHELSNRR